MSAQDQHGWPLTTGNRHFLGRWRWWHRLAYRVVPKCGCCHRAVDDRGVCWYHQP